MKLGTDSKLRMLGLWGLALSFAASCTTGGDAGTIAGPSSDDTDESAYTGLVTQFVETCPAAFMNNDPVAKQCCYTHGSDGERTHHVGVKVAANDPPAVVAIKQQTTVVRTRGTACRKQNGQSNCTGQYNAQTNPNGCFFGPNTWGIAAPLAPPTGTPYGKTLRTGNPTSGGYNCSSTHVTDPVTSSPFGDVTGTTIPGQYDCCNGTIYERTTYVLADPPIVTQVRGCCGGNIYSTATHYCCAGAVTPLSSPPQQCRGSIAEDAATGMWEY